MVRSGRDGERLELLLEGLEAEWLKLENLSLQERALARELDEVREQLFQQARAMKRARIASVAQIAERLDRNRQRVNAWMRTERPTREPKRVRDDGLIDPEAHVPL